MALYLGNQIISSNPTGTGALYLGEQNICTAYLGTAQVFDNCAAANTSVVLTVVNSVTGGGETLVGDLTGATKSGQPGTAFSAFSTSVSLATYYSWATGPTFSGEVGGTFPTTGSITRTTTVGGTTSYNPPAASTVTLTLDDSISGGVFGTAFNYSSSGTSIGGNKYTVTGTVGGSYTFNITSNIISPYTGTITDPSGGTITGIYPSGGASITNTFTGNVSQPSYTLTAGTPTYSGVTGGTAGSNFTFVTLSPSSETKIAGDTYTFTQSGGVAASGWQWNTGPNYAYTIGGASVSLSQAMQSSYGGQTLEVAVSGTGQSVVNSITLGGVPRSCANYSCISPGAGSQQSTTWYYTGSFGIGTVLWSGSGLTGSNPSSGFWANLSGSGSVGYGASGVSSTPSCVSALNYISLGYDSSNSVSACSATNTYYYINGGSLSTSSEIFTDSVGCSGAGPGYFSDGITYAFASASGSISTTGIC